MQVHEARSRTGPASLLLFPSQHGAIIYKTGLTRASLVNTGENVRDRGERRVC